MGKGEGVSGTLSASPRFCCKPTRALKNSPLIKLIKKAVKSNLQAIKPHDHKSFSILGHFVLN